MYCHLNIHLQMVVAMYAHKNFTFDTFSYEVVYDMWSNVQAGNYRGQYAWLWNYFCAFLFHDMLLDNSELT